MGLGWPELREFQDFLGEIFASASIEEFGRTVAARLSRIIPADIASYNEYEVEAARVRYFVAPADVDAPGLNEAFARHLADHPLVRHYAQTGSERALKLSDFLTRSQFHRLGLYGDFYRKVDTEFLLGLRFETRPPVSIAVGLCRKRRDFTESERRVLEALRPHLVQAYRHAEACGSIQRELAETRRALDALDQAVVVLTRDGKVLLQTARAVRLLSAWFAPPAWRASDLPAPLAGWVGRPGPLPAARAPLVIERGERCLVVRLIDREERLMLLVEEHGATLSAESLEPLGLSRREAQVLAWVVEGKSDEAIAIILGISFHTVKKHLEHVYEKLGVESRTAAAAVAHRTASTGH